MFPGKRTLITSDPTTLADWPGQVARVEPLTLSDIYPQLLPIGRE